MLGRVADSILRQHRGDPIGSDFHEFIDGFQKRLNLVGKAIAPQRPFAHPSKEHF